MEYFVSKTDPNADFNSLYAVNRHDQDEGDIFRFANEDFSTESKNITSGGILCKVPNVQFIGNNTKIHRVPGSTACVDTWGYEGTRISGFDLSGSGVGVAIGGAGIEVFDCNIHDIFAAVEAWKESSNHHIHDLTISNVQRGISATLGGKPDKQTGWHVHNIIIDGVSKPDGANGDCYGIGGQCLNDSRWHDIRITNVAAGYVGCEFWVHQSSRMDNNRFHDLYVEAVDAAFILGAGTGDMMTGNRIYRNALEGATFGVRVHNSDPHCNNHVFDNSAVNCGVGFYCSVQTGWNFVGNNPVNCQTDYDVNSNPVT